LGGFDTTTRGAGAFGWVDPDYTSDAGWETYVSRFRAESSSMEKIEAPSMWEMRALTLCGYRDIWFAGRPYGPDMGNVIVNYYRGNWIYYPDPSPYGMDYLHLFSHANGWGFDANRIYRFDGQSWTPWLELGAFTNINPCAFKSQTNVWAVGYYADTTRKSNVVLHYDGAAWKEVFTPGENKYVNDVAMYNDNNGWAVGGEKVGSQSYGRTWQCVNGAWLERVCPVEETVRDVEVVSKTEAWALTAGKILHYQTESNITPASFGRIKTLFAEGRGLDSNAPPTYASRVPCAPPPAAIPRTEGNADVDSNERPADAAD
jgi:hypothetical protein